MLIQREEREVGDDGVGPSWQLRASERETSGVRGRSDACPGPNWPPAGWAAGCSWAELATVQVVCVCVCVFKKNTKEL